MELLLPLAFWSEIPRHEIVLILPITQENKVVTSDTEGQLCLWKFTTSNLVPHIMMEGHQTEIFSLLLVLCDTEPTILSISSDGMMKIWNLSEGRCLNERSHGSGVLSAVGLGTRFAVARDHFTVEIFDTISLSLIHSIVHMTTPISVLGLADVSTASLLALGGSDGTVSVYNVSSPTSPPPLLHHLPLNCYLSSQCVLFVVALETGIFFVATCSSLLIYSVAEESVLSQTLLDRDTQELYGCWSRFFLVNKNHVLCLSDSNKIFLYSITQQYKTTAPLHIQDLSPGTSCTYAYPYIWTSQHDTLSLHEFIPPQTPQSLVSERFGGSHMAPFFDNLLGSANASLFLTDEFRLVIGFSSGKLMHYKLPSDPFPKIISAHKKKITALLRLPQHSDQHLIISASSSSDICVWDCFTLEQRHSFSLLESPVEFLRACVDEFSSSSFSYPINNTTKSEYNWVPWSSCFFAQTLDSVIHLFTLEKYQRLMTFRPCPIGGGISAFTWSLIANQLSIQLFDQSVSVWDLSSGTIESKMFGKLAKEVFSYSLAKMKVEQMKDSPSSEEQSQNLMELRHHQFGKTSIQYIVLDLRTICYRLTRVIKPPMFLQATSAFRTNSEPNWDIKPELHPSNVISDIQVIKNARITPPSNTNLCLSDSNTEAESTDYDSEVTIQGPFESVAQKFNTQSVVQKFNTHLRTFSPPISRKLSRLSNGDPHNQIHFPSESTSSQKLPTSPAPSAPFSQHSPKFTLKESPVRNLPEYLIMTYLLPWNTQKNMDLSFKRELGIPKPTKIPFTFGVMGDNNKNTSFLHPKIWKDSPPGSFQVSSLISGLISLAAVSLISILRKYSDAITKQLCKEVLSLYTKIIPQTTDSYCEPSLPLLAACWTDPNKQIIKGARLLFFCVLERLSLDEKQNLVNYWTNQMKQSPVNSTHRSLSFFVLGILGSFKSDILTDDISKQVAEFLVEVLHNDPPTSLTTASTDLLSQGFGHWCKFLNDPAAVVRRFLSLRLFSKPLNLASVASRATLYIGRNHPDILLSAITYVENPNSSFMCVALELLNRLILKKPSLYLPHLSTLIIFILKALDPRDHTLRESLLSCTTTALLTICKAYPMVHFHQDTQKLALGTFDGKLLLFDLRTATKINTFICEQGLPISAVQFSPSGKKIASYSYTESKVHVWGLHKSLFGIFSNNHPMYFFNIPHEETTFVPEDLLQTVYFRWTSEFNFILYRAWVGPTSFRFTK